MTRKAYIISLDRAPDRREKAIQEACNAGLDYEIVTAWDARDFKRDDGSVDWEKLHKKLPFSNARWGAKFLPSEVCIAWSHIKAYNKIIDDGHEGAFIMEDDWCLTGGSSFGVQEVASELEKTDKWMHCMLHHEHLGLNPSYRVIDKSNPILWQVRQTPLIGVAYAASRNFCQHFVKHYSFMDAPHDHMMCRISQNPNLKFLQASEPVCGSAGFQTTQE